MWVNFNGPVIKVSPAAGVGLLDILLEYEATETIPQKQRYIAELTILNGVEHMTRAIEDVDSGSEHLRVKQTNRYLYQIKRLNPKKDLYGVPKVPKSLQKSGMRSSISTSVVGNIATMEEMTITFHTMPLTADEESQGWIHPGSAPINIWIDGWMDTWID